MNPKEGVRTLARAHQIFPLEYWHSVLYLGLHSKTFTRWNGGFWLKEIIHKHNNDDIHVDIVECNIHNIRNSQESEFGIKYDDYLSYHEDYWEPYLQKLDTNFTYNVCIWWHGPEHIEKEEFLRIDKLLKERVDGLIILACPEGNDPCYDVQEGNFIDQHKWEAWPTDFHNLGYVTEEYERPTNNRGARAISAFYDCRKE